MQTRRVGADGLRALAVAWLCLASLAQAGSPLRWEHWRWCGGPLPCACPDDYCPKPLPCVPCVRKSCCPDDYCAKPLPCVPRQCSCCPDNYCPKPFPVLCRGQCSEHLSCGAPSCRSAAIAPAADPIVPSSLDR